ncbi:MAG: fumarate reductase/succinate dehydrogenase flavoprotein subunit, partial [Acidimicrobiales bacterium]
PYRIQQELQDAMQDLVGIIRREHEMQLALKTIRDLKERATALSVEGHRQYNPGWNLALDLRNMLLVAEGVALAAMERKESRGGHTRDDFPMTDYEFWGKSNVVVELGADQAVSLRLQDLPEPPPELAALLEEAH